jgi:4-diphosphocytidyl-2C-methyl-D-erythritol kinase
MNNNIFLQNKKFNPDISKKLSEKQNSRNCSFKQTNEIINPITGDTKLNKLILDSPDKNINSKMSNLESERSNQDYLIKESLKNNRFNDRVVINDQKNHNDLKKNIKKKDEKVDDILNSLKSMGILN